MPKGTTDGGRQGLGKGTRKSQQFLISILSVEGVQSGKVVQYGKSLSRGTAPREGSQGQVLAGMREY